MKIVRYVCDGCGKEVSFVSYMNLWRFVGFRTNRLCPECVSAISELLTTRKQILEHPIQEHELNHPIRKPRPPYRRPKGD